MELDISELTSLAAEIARSKEETTEKSRYKALLSKSLSYSYEFRLLSSSSYTASLIS